MNRGKSRMRSTLVGVFLFSMSVSWAFAQQAGAQTDNSASGGGAAASVLARALAYSYPQDAVQAYESSEPRGTNPTRAETWNVVRWSRASSVT